MHGKRLNGRYDIHKMIPYADPTLKMLLQMHFVAGGRTDTATVQAVRADL